MSRNHNQPMVFHGYYVHEMFTNLVNYPGVLKPEVVIHVSKSLQNVSGFPWFSQLEDVISR